MAIISFIVLHKESANISSLYVISGFILGLIPTKYY